MPHNVRCWVNPIPQRPSSLPGLRLTVASHTYTWLDQQKRPIKIPACQYILLVQKWIEGKFDDRTLFPIDNNLPPSLSAANTPGSKDWLGTILLFSPPSPSLYNAHQLIQRLQANPPASRKASRPT